MGLVCWLQPVPLDYHSLWVYLSFLSTTSPMRSVSRPRCDPIVQALRAHRSYRFASRREAPSSLCDPMRHRIAGILNRLIGSMLSWKSLCRMPGSKRKYLHMDQPDPIQKAFEMLNSGSGLSAESERSQIIPLSMPLHLRAQDLTTIPDAECCRNIRREREWWRGRVLDDKTAISCVVSRYRIWGWYKDHSAMDQVHMPLSVFPAMRRSHWRHIIIIP